MNIGSYVTLRHALGNQGDDQSDTEVSEGVVLPQDSPVSFETYYVEVDVIELEEPIPGSFASCIELQRKRSHRAAADKASARLFAWNCGQTVFLEKENSQESAKCSGNRLQSSSKSISLLFA